MCCVWIYYCLLFCIGIDHTICVSTSLSCCPREVEQAMSDAAFANTRDMLPPYSQYLNESERVFFPHYGQRVT